MSGRQQPANLARELLEEIDIVGALGRPADQFIDLMGVWPDQNAPLVGLDSVEDDRRRFGGAGRRLLAEAALALGDPRSSIPLNTRKVQSGNQVAHISRCSNTWY